MTDNLPEPNRLPYWLRRLWPLYCFLAALVTFGYALYEGYQIDGDAGEVTLHLQQWREMGFVVHEAAYRQQIGERLADQRVLLVAEPG